MGSGRRTGWAAVAAAALLAVAAPADAQRRDPGGWRDGGPVGPPAAWVGLDFLVADPVGDFGVLVDDGFGGRLEGILPVTGVPALGVRLDAGFLVYGHERQAACFPLPIGCRIGLDLTTDNAIFFAGVGPELAVPGPLSPYVNGQVGFSWFATTSSLSGDYGHEPFARTQHFSDFVGSGRLGGGVRVRVKGGRHPLLLDLGAQYHRNGVAEYLVEGDIEDRPDGSIVLYPNRTEANLVTVNLGLKVGIPRGDRDDRRRW